ncbi:MAG: hypothetical protein MI863_23370 [Desulfobacterales bacterium]|nr:hypothetical protein [Desulfobacterales bacterium]
MTNDFRWDHCKDGISLLFNKVQNGKDISSHLSLKVNSKGFINPKENNYDSWNDKDLLLNVMGYHHFHLGTNIENNGFITRSDEVLFARVSHNLFKAIAIFNHSVFESNNNQLSDERNRLWEIFDKDILEGHPPGSVVMPPPITFSGHPMQIVAQAQNYSFILNEYDPKLDEKEFIESLFINKIVPKKPKFEWMINASGIGVYEKKTETFFILKNGIN